MIDLSGARAPQRTRVPLIYGSGERRGPAAERTSRRESLESSRRVRLPSQPVTRDSILDRYRGSDPTRPGQQAAEVSGRGTGEGRGAGPSKQRGAALRDAGEVSRSGRTPATSATRQPRATTAELRSQHERREFHRLQELAQTNPAQARALYNKSQGIAHATSTSLQVGVAAGFAAVGCHGWNGFWSPKHHPYGSWGWWTGWSTWCGPGSWWWWNSCAFWNPWAPSWGFGFGYYGFGWSSWHYPYYGYWAPAPVYYSYVVYDRVEPAPAPTVIYEEAPAVEEEAAPVAEGEASVEVREPQGTSALGESLGRAAGHYLTLGDRAFREGRYGDAVHFYAKAVEFSPDDGVLYLILSDALFATGDYHYAAYALRRALELDPRLVDSVVDKHGFYGDPAEFDRQLRMLEGYLDDHFLDDDARLVLSANYLFADQPERAVELLGSAFSTDVRESRAGELLLERARAALAERTRPR